VPDRRAGGPSQGSQPLWAQLEAGLNSGGGGGGGGGFLRQSLTSGLLFQGPSRASLGLGLPGEPRTSRDLQGWQPQPHGHGLGQGSQQGLGHGHSQGLGQGSAAHHGLGQAGYGAAQAAPQLFPLSTAAGRRSGMGADLLSLRPLRGGSSNGLAGGPLGAQGLEAAAGRGLGGLGGVRSLEESLELLAAQRAQAQVQAQGGGLGAQQGTGLAGGGLSQWYSRLMGGAGAPAAQPGGLGGVGRGYSSPAPHLNLADSLQPLQLGLQRDVPWHAGGARPGAEAAGHGSGLMGGGGGSDSRLRPMDEPSFGVDVVTLGLESGSLLDAMDESGAEAALAGRGAEGLYGLGAGGADVLGEAILRRAAQQHMLLHGSGWGGLQGERHRHL
jgi:hypothetical protein